MYSPDLTTAKCIQLQLTKGCWVVVELTQGTDGVLMLSELNKAQAARAGQPISRVEPFRVCQHLGLLHMGLGFGGVLLHLHHTRNGMIRFMPIPRFVSHQVKLFCGMKVQ